MSGSGACKQAVDRLKRLNPRPGMAYASSEPRYVLPDVCVERVNGEYVVLVNEGFFPRLTVSDQYQRMMAEGGERARQAADYLRNWFQSAVWLVRGIEQRRQTLYRVTQSDRRETKGFSGSRRRPPEAPHPARSGGRAGIARVHRQPRHAKQVRANASRPLFHSGISSRPAWIPCPGGASAKSVKKRIVGADSEGEISKNPCLISGSQTAPGGRDPDLPPHGGQISGGARESPPRWPGGGTTKDA